MPNSRLNEGDAARALAFLSDALVIVDTLDKPEIAARLQDVIDRLSDAVPSGQERRLAQN